MVVRRMKAKVAFPSQKAERELVLKASQDEAELNSKRMLEDGLPPKKRMVGVAEAAAREGQRRSQHFKNHFPPVIAT